MRVGVRLAVLVLIATLSTHPLLPFVKKKLWWLQKMLKALPRASIWFVHSGLETVAQQDRRGPVRL